MFGELKVTWGDFTNCGVHHCQGKTTKETSLDQAHYAQNLMPISHIQLGTGKPEDEAVAQLKNLYMSFLGAVAYLTQTRIDIFSSSVLRSGTPTSHW